MEGVMAGRITTVQFDERAVENIDKLREVYGATSTAAVIRRALALASMVADEATPERTVTIKGKRDPITESLAG
jgi:hypothetical protein